MTTSNQNLATAINIKDLNEYIATLRYRYGYIEVQGLCSLRYASVEEAVEHCKHPALFFWIAEKLKLPTSKQLPIVLDIMEMSSGQFPEQNCYNALEYMKNDKYSIEGNEKVLGGFAYDPQHKLINAVRHTFTKALRLDTYFTEVVEVFAQYVARDKKLVVTQAEIAKKLLFLQ